MNPDVHQRPDTQVVDRWSSASLRSRGQRPRHKEAAHVNLPDDSAHKAPQAGAPPAVAPEPAREEQQGDNRQRRLCPQLAFGEAPGGNGPTAINAALHLHAARSCAPDFVSNATSSRIAATLSHTTRRRECVTGVSGAEPPDRPTNTSRLRAALGTAMRTACRAPGIAPVVAARTVCE